MKIYIVTRNVAYEGSYIYALFSTNDKAEWFLKDVPKETEDGRDYYVIRSFEGSGRDEYFVIEEYEIDEFVELRTAERKKWILYGLKSLIGRRNQLEHKGTFEDSSIIKRIYIERERYYESLNKYFNGKYLMSFLSWKKTVDPIYCNPDDKYCEIQKHSLQEYAPGDKWCSECGEHIKEDIEKKIDSFFEKQEVDQK